MKKIILILMFMFLSLGAITIENSKVKNANTTLLILNKKDISDVKLSFDNHHIKFFKNPFKQDSFYALLPVHYYKKLQKYRVIISYLKNNKREFEGINLEVIDGNYKKEIIKVAKSKVTLSKKNEKRVKKEYKEAIALYNITTQELLFKNKFINPINSKITSQFGNKRVYNDKIKSYHSGTDFRAKVGTKIKASNDGVIKLAQNRFYAGNSIVIDHGQGIYTCYYHLSKMNFKVGDKVKRGDIIGLSGATGRITGPHLHYSARVHGIQVDPMQLMQILNKLVTNQ